MKILFFGKYNCKYSMKLLNLTKKYELGNFRCMACRRQREKIPQNVQNWKSIIYFAFVHIIFKKIFYPMQK